MIKTTKEEIGKLLENAQSILKGASKNSFTFLLVGRTGVGKSATINSLMGEKVAEDGKYEPTTFEVKKYKGLHNDVQYYVYDTPGLCDALPEEGNDQRYIDKMKKEVEGVDVMCFVTPLDDLRVSSDEQRAIRSLSEAFGYEIWQYSVIIFTFSNKVEPEEFEEAFNKRKQLIVDVIKKYTGENIADEIPAVAIDNRHETNPDGQKWLGELFTRIFTRMSNTGLKSFFLAMSKDLKKSPPLQIQSSWNHSAEKKESERIELNKRQKAEIRKTIDAKIIPGLAAAGAGIGATFGPVGAAVGGLIGGAIGFIAWLWD